MRWRRQRRPHAPAVVWLRRGVGRHGGHDARAAAGHTVPMPRVYQPDHTAHIRRSLSEQALYFAAGLVMAVLVAIVTQVLTTILGTRTTPW